jgi:hypothetical protein
MRQWSGEYKNDNAIVSARDEIDTQQRLRPLLMTNGSLRMRLKCRESYWISWFLIA